MEKKTKSKSASADEINLKHRITGAGVLIFFGVLVLPWLLGPPSEAQKGPADEMVTSADNQAVLRSTFEDEVLAELEGENEIFEEPEESVYVSKITPVGSSPNKPEKLDEKKPPEKAKDQAAESKIAAAVVTKVADSGGGTKSQAEKPQQARAENGGAKDNANSNKVAKSTHQSKKPEVVSSSSPVRKLDVGWVVQVELLTDKNGASKLVSELKTKGFSPQTTIVDTNRGKKTGTRIWLGPFESRNKAGNENDRLEKIMGKRGFIRVYP
ncbi:hypothetical protein NBRC116583_21660 [Arenicella sp. 4NH20-0111]|uniref:SPOR domain-containing protein n=1 Tax=Arenicella sp. 4NH20-0111 TaxID=3127648 RepID=UPI003104D855